MQRNLRLWLALSVLLFGGQQAAAATAKEIFEKFGLIGAFSQNCEQPVRKNNLYFVHRLVDENHVQRDLMSGPTTREWVIIIDRAEERGPNQVFFAGHRDGVRGEGLWRVEKNRILQLEGSLGGKKLLVGGKALATGVTMPWLTKCNSGAQ
jgi:hypothetical protein